MKMARKNKGAVEWHLNGRKKPFAYSTVSESDSIRILLLDYGDLNKVLEAYKIGKIILSSKEVYIIEYFVNHGESIPHL